jgi:hypothetical protein
MEEKTQEQLLEELYSEITPITIILDDLDDMADLIEEIDRN